MKTSEVFLAPEEKTGDPFILSRKKACAPFSFCDPGTHKPMDESPCPVYQSLDDLNFEKPISKEILLENFSLEKNGSLKLKDEDIKERQRGIITDVLKNLKTNIISGKSIVGLSMPVRIFEPRSQIERVTDAMRFYPYYLGKASKIKDPVERIKFIHQGMFSALFQCLGQLKPFNPLLGETFQAKLDKDTIINAEHISHHPPISCYYVTNPEWTFDAKWTYNAEIGMNLVQFNEGWGKITFKDGDVYQIIYPSGQIKGLLAGSRSINLIDAFFIKNEKNGLKLVNKIGEKTKKGFLSSMLSSSKLDGLSGSIYKYDKDKDESYKKLEWRAMQKKLCEADDIVEEICKISGNYTKELKYDKETIWQFEDLTENMNYQNFIKDPLPSDVRFREDVIWLAYGNEDYAQKWKILLEKQQRKDRANRKLGMEKKKK